ncbi:MAG: HesA/MoeB/ThiF family protein [Spirochaetia bacterium]|nr:HesA/MoeB/ThiF family protein [Spirochaetia bacterium]
MDFSENQLERYSRHILLNEIGIEGQAKLLSSSVLVIGAGGLGSPALLYLAAAGVGKLGIADSDRVDLSNLQRQIIHSTPDVGVDKVISAKEKIHSLNSDVQVEIFGSIHEENIQNIIKNYDFVIDGTDNFASKFLINDACVLSKIPFSHGGILRFQGQTITVLPGETACYRCIFDSPPPGDSVPTCSTAGVLGSIAGMLGTIQATEAVKYLTSIGEPLYNSLLTFDALDMNFRKIKLRKNPQCRVCGENPVISKPLMESSRKSC